MARDRKRAKQRQRQRRAQGQAERVSARPDAPEPALPGDEPDPVLDAPPDPLEHASGDAEIAEAAEHAVAELDGPTTPLQEDEYPQPDELEGADALEEEPEELAPERRRRARQPRTGPGRELPR